MKNIRIFLSENFPILVVKFSIYLNRRAFVMAEFSDNFCDEAVSACHIFVISS